MEDKLRSKLLKLYELAKRGVRGEKVNAEVILDKMLKKHGFTLEDINQEIPKKRYYKYSTKMKKSLITQIICKVTNRLAIYEHGNYKHLSTEATDYEHVQILELIDFHFKNFEEERKQFIQDFTGAYIQKHRLFKKTTDEDRENRQPLTSDEKAAIWRMSNIMEGMSNKTYVKKLE